MYKKIKGKLARLALVGVILSTAILAALVPTTSVFASTLNLQVNSSTDDAWYYVNTGAWTFVTNGINVGTGVINATYPKMGGGYVFDNVTIPAGATIDVAYLQFQSDNTTAGTAMKTVIYGQDTGNASTFSTEADFKNRWGVNGGTDNRTTAFVEWDDQAAWVYTTWYDSPSIVAIVQEIVDRGDWGSGNSMAFTWNDWAQESADGNYRYPLAYDTGAANAPKLHIEYTATTLATTTVAADNVGVISARLKGTLDNLGGEASADYYFEWDTDTGAPYANNTSATKDVLAAPGAFNETVSGFTPADTIYYRTKVYNGVTTVYGAEHNFTLSNYVIDFYGDSVTVGYNSSNHLTTSWVGRVATATGFDQNNEGIAGAMLHQMIPAIYNNTITADSISAALLGYNDVAYWGVYFPPSMVGFSYSIKSALAKMAIPSADLTVATSGAVAYTGTWTNSVIFTGITSKYCGTAGSTATVTLTGTTIYIDSVQLYGQTRGIQVSIDGVNKGTFNSSTALETAPFLLRFGGLSSAAHTVVVTTTTGTGNVYISWFAASDGTPNSAKVYVGGALYKLNYGTYGQPYGYGSDAATDQYNSLISDAVTMLNGDGYDVSYISVNDYYDPNTGLDYGELTHPNDTGHQQIADAFLASMALVGEVAGHTDAATAVTTTTATLNGEVTDMGGEGTIECYFQYGATVAYGSDTLASHDDLVGTGTFDVGIGTLSAGSTYHFRAVLHFGSDYVYGADMQFTTTSVGSVGVPSNFKIDSFTADSITLSWIKGGGANNTLIKYSLAGYPTDTDEGTQLYSGVGTSTTHSGLTAGTRIYYSAWGEAGGIYSTTYVTVTGVPTADVLAAPDTLEIETVQVYRNFINAGDQLIVFSSKILWDDGTPTTYNASDFFYIQVLDAGIVIKQDRIKMWGYVPNSLYISSTSTITWNKEYTVRIIGTNRYTTPPVTTYTLTAPNYIGDDWNGLANWVLDLARRMQDSIYWNTLLETSGTDTILNSQGTQVFNTGIPGLAGKCPQLFYPEGTASKYVQPTKPMDYLEQLAASRAEKQGTVVENAISGLATVTGQSVNNTALALWLGIYALVVFVIMKAGAHGSNALLFGYPCVLIGTWAGGVSMDIPIAIGIILTVLFLYNHIVRQGG